MQIVGLDIPRKTRKKKKKKKKKEEKTRIK
jgi:hypothetical protein